jgi:hypothetical protein
MRSKVADETGLPTEVSSGRTSSTTNTMATRRAVESTPGQQIVEHRLTDLFAIIRQFIRTTRFWDVLQVSKVAMELSDEFGGREHLASFSIHTFDRRQLAARASASQKK